MTDLKRCLRKSKHGCSQEKPHYEFDGEQRRCRECQAKFEEAGAARKRRAGKLPEVRPCAVGGWGWHV